MVQFTAYIALNLSRGLHIVLFLTVLLVCPHENSSSNIFSGLWCRADVIQVSTKQTKRDDMFWYLLYQASS